MAKKKKKNKITSKKYLKYKIEGKIIKRQQTCPKCGPGIFLAKHKDRQTCGSCKYTEFKGKEQPKPEEKPAEKPEQEKPKEEKPAEEKK